MNREHSPDGLDFSVYIQVVPGIPKLIAKFADRDFAIRFSGMCTMGKVWVNQYDPDYSPHLGRKIWP